MHNRRSGMKWAATRSVCRDKQLTRIWMSCVNNLPVFRCSKLKILTASPDIHTILRTFFGMRRKARQLDVQQGEWFYRGRRFRRTGLSSISTGGRIGHNRGVALSSIVKPRLGLCKSEPKQRGVESYFQSASQYTQDGSQGKLKLEQISKSSNWHTDDECDE